MRLIARIAALWIAAGIASPAAVFASDVGMVAMFYSTFCPTNWTQADNTQVPTSQYSEDYYRAVNSITDGVPCNGPLGCYTPDLRGYFFRALDKVKVRDTQFRIVGSTETDTDQYLQGLAGTVQNVGATGPFTWVSNGQTKGGGSTPLGTLAFDNSRSIRTSAESRPRNVALLACIKTKDTEVGMVSSSFTLVEVSTTAAAQMNPGIWGYFTAGDVSFWFGVLVAIIAIVGFKAGGLR